MTAFIRSAGSRSFVVQRFLERANTADVDISLAELEHPSWKKLTSFCSGRVPIYVHHSLYRTLKLRFAWILEDCPEIAELPLNSAPTLCDTPSASRDFPDHWWHCVGKWIRMTKPYQFECAETEGSKQVWGFAWYYLPTPPLGQGMTQGQFLSGV